MGKFEDFPNEIVYEMFDYLKTSDIFESFYYLNIRYRNLVVNSPLNFQINFSNLTKSKFEDCCKYLIEANKSHVYSLYFPNPLTIDRFVTRFSFNKSFNHLESITFSQINFSTLEPILKSLSNLSRLYSLTIKDNIEVCDSSQIYRLIFNLPVLKTCIIYPRFYGGSILLNHAKNPSESIETLSIHRHCSLNQFLTLLSYTPNLRRLANLSISETTNSNFNSLIIKSTKLTKISLKLCRMSFESFKYLSSKLFVNLEILNVCTRADDYYLIAERWEQLIIHNLPNLRIFNFQHYWEPVDNSENEQNTYHRWIERFTMPFWIDRQWFFAHQHFSRRGVRDAVFYSTNPFRRNLYELHERAHNDDCPRRDRGRNLARRVNIDDYRAAINSSLRFPFTNDLCLWGKSARGNFSFIADLNHMFDFTKLTHFSVQCPDFGYQQLIQLLNHLPNVYSLILYTNTSYLSLENLSLDNHLKSSNRIRHVTVRGLCHIEQIHLLMNITPNVYCLEIEIDDEQFEFILRFLLLNKQLHQQFDSKKTKFDGWQKRFFHLFNRIQTKKHLSFDDLSISSFNQSISNHNNQLFLIAFFNPKAFFEQKLQRILVKEKFLDHYQILSAFNYVYLWW